MIKALKFWKSNIVKKVGKQDLNSVQFFQLYDKYSYYTMLSKSVFVENLKLCQSFSHIKGCIVECGVWRGGMIAAISEILGNDRKYFLFDSFEGLPEVQEIDGDAARNWQSDKEGPMYHNNCKAEIDYADKAMKISGTQNYQLVKGWFVESLSAFNTDEEIAILRLDADWYKSTMQCLNFLYPKVSKGGLIIVDDYYTWDGCSRAIHDYLSTHKLTDKIYQLNQCNCYIIKS